MELHLGRLLAFWVSKRYTGESSFETADELQEKVMNILTSMPTSTFRAVFEEWKS
jgi:hypothetical protein